MLVPILLNFRVRISKKDAQVQGTSKRPPCAKGAPAKRVGDCSVLVLYRSLRLAFGEPPPFAQGRLVFSEILPYTPGEAF